MTDYQQDELDLFGDPEPPRRRMGFVTRSACGHVSWNRGQASPGQWITCADGKCQSQRKVVACWPAPMPEGRDDA